MRQRRRQRADARNRARRPLLSVAAHLRARAGGRGARRCSCSRWSSDARRRMARQALERPRCCASSRSSARVHGELAGAGGNVLVVANHISWLDIFVLNAHHPVRFVAKAEIAHWPVLSQMIARRGHAVHRARAAARHASRHPGDRAACSPAATSSRSFPRARRPYGTDVLPFKSSLLQPIVEADGHVQPVAIRYRTPDGEPRDGADLRGRHDVLRVVLGACAANAR